MTKPQLNTRPFIYRDDLELFVYNEITRLLITGTTMPFQLNAFQQYLDYQTKNRRSFQISVDRQVGKTTFLTLYALQQMLFCPETDIILFSASYMGSQNTWLRLKHLLRQDIDPALLKICRGSIKQDKSTILFLENNSSFTIAPATYSGCCSTQARIVLIDDYTTFNQSAVFDHVKMMQPEQIIALA